MSSYVFLIVAYLGIDMYAKAHGIHVPVIEQVGVIVAMIWAVCYDVRQMQRK